MGKTTRANSTKSKEPDEVDDLCDRVWDKLKDNLSVWINDWLSENLSVIKKAVDRYASTSTFADSTKIVVDNYLSSTEFKESLNKSFTYDLDSLDDKLKTLETNTTDITAEMSSLENKISELQESMSKELKPNESYTNLSQRNDDLEQYTRRVNVRICGVAEQEHENTDLLAQEFFSKQLGYDVDPNDISRSHRVGRKSATKPRAIIVRFVRHNVKAMVMRLRRKLKGNNSTKYALFEDLTVSRRNILSHLKTNAKEKVNKVWTIDGVVYFRPQVNSSIVETCTSLNDCIKILSKY